MRFALIGIVLAVCALVGCATVVPRTGEARWGSVRKDGPLRLVVFPASCADQGGLCDRIDPVSVSQTIAAELEFAGHTIIDGATLVRTAVQREASGASLRLYGQRFLDLQSQRAQGSWFEDLPPAARRELLAEARADGILRTRLTALSRPLPYSGLMEIQLRLGLGDDEVPGWTARCQFEGADRETLDQIPLWREAVVQGVRCALDAVRAR